MAPQDLKLHCVRITFLAGPLNVVYFQLAESKVFTASTVQSPPVPEQPTVQMPDASSLSNT